MASWTKIKREIDFGEVTKITATRAETIDGIVYSQTLDFLVPEDDQETIYSYTKEQTATYLDGKIPVSTIDQSLTDTAAAGLPSDDAGTISEPSSDEGAPLDAGD